MKRVLQLTIAIIILSTLGAIAAQAQTTSSQTLRANVPFTFTVGEKSLPPGVYTIRILNPASDRKALQIRSEDGRSSAIVQTMGVNGALIDHAKIVFHRYGERHFFAEAQMAGDTTSQTAARTRAERATQRSIKRPADRGTVAIVAN